MEPISLQVEYYSKQCYGSEDQLDYETLSPFTPLSLYQSAVVQIRLCRHNNDPRHEDALLSLRKVLSHFAKRWAIAGKSSSLDYTLWLQMLIDNQNIIWRL